MNESNPGERLTDRKRAAILEAALSEFQTRGFDATSMDQIAGTAAVSKRTVYNHFASKEALFAAIVSELMGRCAFMFEFAYDSDRPLRDQLSQIGRSIVDLQSSPDFQNLARAALSRFLRSPEVFSDSVGDAEKYLLGLANWIKSACRAGRLSTGDAERAAQQFVGILEAFAFWPQIIGKSAVLTDDEKDSLVASTVAMFLDHYAASPDDSSGRDD